MKNNINKKIIAKKSVLVPYEKEHVAKYHEWMKSEELQELTASEPLTLQQEYEMQQSWRNDENKCTFIIVKCEKLEGEDITEIDCMVGDVNLFFNDEDDLTTAEIEIMIAERYDRGKGYGREALFTMMRYGVEDLGLCSITAKIGSSNTPSLSMFKKIGFNVISESEVFSEVTLELKITEDVRKQIQAETELYKIESYR